MKIVKKGIKLRSLLYEETVYISTGEIIKTFFADNVIVIKRSKSKNTFCAVQIDTPKNIETNSFFKNKWHRFIGTPCRSHFIWPIDLILLNDLEPQCFLVYNFVSDSRYQSLSQLAFSQKIYGVENKAARAIAIELAKAFVFLEGNHFLFIGLDDDTIFVNDKMTRVLLPIHELMIPDDEKEIYFSQKDFFSEVIDPFSYNNSKIMKSGNKIFTYDKASEYFAFVSVLFKIMIGLYPFEGPYVSEFAYSTNSEANIEWINRYLQNPVFVFDPVDTSNSVSIYNKNIIHCQRWNEISEDMREMFISTFKNENVLRSKLPLECYSANQWYTALKNDFLKYDQNE